MSDPRFHRAPTQKELEERKRRVNTIGALLHDSLEDIERIKKEG